MNLWDSAWTIIDRYLEYLSPDEKSGITNEGDSRTERRRLAAQILTAWSIPPLRLFPLWSSAVGLFRIFGTKRNSNPPPDRKFPKDSVHRYRYRHRSKLIVRFNSSSKGTEEGETLIQMASAEFTEGSCPSGIVFSRNVNCRSQLSV